MKITVISQKFQYHTANGGSNQVEFKSKLLSMYVSDNMDRSADIRSIAWDKIYKPNSYIIDTLDKDHKLKLAGL